MLTIVVHHTVFDGWSAGVLVHELAALYRQEAGGEPARLPDLAVQFADYALWERDRLQGPALAELEDYWRTTMDGFETVQLPTDRPRPVLDNFDGGIVERLAGRDLLDGLRELSRREGTTLFVTLMAGMLALLGRYTGQDDLVVGTVSANRGRAELAPLIGFLVNTLPIRADLSGDPPFTRAAGPGPGGHRWAPTPTRTCRSASWCRRCGWTATRAGRRSSRSRWSTPSATPRRWPRPGSRSRSPT